MGKHEFVGMRRIDAAEPFTVGMVVFGPGVYWAGVCACGEVQLPASDKDTAWEEFADHIERNMPELRAIAERNALINILNRMTPEQLTAVLRD
jgi:hypothetical protein